MGNTWLYFQITDDHKTPTLIYSSVYAWVLLTLSGSGGGGGGGMPAAHNSNHNSNHGIEMKFGRVVENHKLINLVWFN